MDESIRKAAFVGKIAIGDVAIDCAVVEDGTRVLSERAVSKALGSKRGGSHWRRMKEDADDDYFPVYLSAKNLRPYISNELRDALNNRIQYRLKGNGAIAFGIKASALPQICDVFLKARDDKSLLKSQEHIVKQADVLIRGLAHVGIIALVDEATGYQEVRERRALEKILEKFISKELLPWTKQFPDDFYKEIFRLRNWTQPLKGKRPSVIGHYTNNLVYDRLAPGILEELKRVTPKNQQGKRKNRFHQHLTADTGHPKLSAHLTTTITLMKASRSWSEFQRLMDRVCPKFGNSIPLFDIDEDNEYGYGD